MVNVAANVWTNAANDPDRVALRSSRGDLTYGQLRSASSRVAGAVKAAGLQPLDRVVFIAPSIIEFPVVYYGLHAAGVSVITMNTMATAPEIGYVLDDSEAVLVLVWHECADAARAAAADRGLDLWIVDEGASFDAEPVEVAHDHAPDDTAIILYTSGTTGRPKGVELTASNLLDTTSSFLPVLALSEDDRFGTALPLFHVYGQAVVMNTVLVTGSSLSVLSPFEPTAMLEMLRRDRLTAMAGVPTMWNAMLHAAADYGPSDFEHLRLATSGGASLPVEVMRAFNERFDCAILEGYGLTESTGAATFNDINRVQKAGTVGPALPRSQIEVRDAEGTPVAAGTVGEVFIKGPTIMKGYRNRPEATAEDLQDGWLKTGDLGTLDEDGYLSIVDRAKDLIIRGGYNVYPREVEEILYEHPDIVEVAVVGVPDDHFGEEVAAVIALRPGSTATGQEIRAWAKVQLSAYKVPRLFQFVESLPKGATGKILKREIDRDAIRVAAAGATA
ncbi:AMP-dependent synthetase [Aeromicrobium sp. A1-2]|uniref:AMP-binding protein n=1 Tax=Aeromicrobium sp. A1-2 TaxID=2107713 RepID=UPI000E502A20|nr:AMP-binding protein [Aeromicrobium sp. A1-2]AXT86136.1 AMP-dependent synthetase [Aeromicrobium sp. A1-2]